MNRKARFLMMLISLSILLCFMSNTYSRYVAGTTGDINATFSRWQILVNNHDITTNVSSTIPIDPIIEENAHIMNNTLAPTSKGYFDIEIDPTNVDVSFKYIIDLDLDNALVPDLLLTRYAIVPQGYDGTTPLNFVNLTGSSISNTLLFNNSINAFRFQAFTIRVFFEWYQGDDKIMTDEEESAIGLLASEISWKVEANISFEQVITS